MIERAPGGPGTAPTWTSSAKDMVGCALGMSRLWFTLGFGIVNEVYYPRVDIPQIRDLGFIIADGEGFWAEVKRVANYRIRLSAPGVPAVEVVHEHERYTLRLRIAPSVRRDVLALECRLDGDPKLRPYVLLAPHLGATGYGNRSEVVMYRRRRTLWAEQGPFGAALAAALRADKWPPARYGRGQGRLADGIRLRPCKGKGYGGQAPTWSYDDRGRMASATVGGVTTHYGINGLGQRISKWASGVPNGGLNEYVYDLAGHLIGEYDSSGAIICEDWPPIDQVGKGRVRHPA